MRSSLLHLRSSVALRSSLILACALLTQAAATEPSVAPVEITYTDVSVDQVALFDRALESFAAAGLALPPIDVVGHRSDQACDGRAGAHAYEHGRSRIDLCTARAGPAQEFLVLHELAHAWDRKALTPARRDAFLELRGLREWRNGDLDRWHERGAEHAAEIIAWGLIDRSVRIVPLEPNSCADLVLGYRQLTGAEPPHGHPGGCGDVGARDRT